VASAQARVEPSSAELVTLGGITRIAGMVYDREGGDIILVGLAYPGLPEATLDDLVVALRARLLYESWPCVSIDPVPETQTTALQTVHFDGHIEDTAFGRSFLDSDILLKKYSLQMVQPVPAVHSYNVLVEDDIRTAAEALGVKLLGVQWRAGGTGPELCAAERGRPVDSFESYQARFWFYVMDPFSYAAKGDVFGIKELRLELRSECAFDGASAGLRTAQQRFEREWTEHMKEMFEAYPELRRLKVLYDLTAVAEAVRGIDRQPYLQYFLDDYAVRKVVTPQTYKLEELYGLIRRSDGLHHLVRVSGGIDFRAEIKWLNDGDFTPLRDIVLKTRPSPDALTWSLPLEDWRVQNARDLDSSSLAPVPSTVDAARGRAGCSVVCQSYLIDPKASGSGEVFTGFTLPSAVLPPLKGVSMHMKLDNESFRSDGTEELERLRKELLEARPSPDSSDWPAAGKGK